MSGLIEATKIRTMAGDPASLGRGSVFAAV